MTKPHYLSHRYLSFFLAFCLFSPVFSQNAKKFFKSGHDFYQSGNYQDAIAQFTSTINLSPEYKEAYEYRGLSYQFLNEHQKAADDFNRAMVFDPENEILLTCLAKSYLALKRYPEALDLLHRATTLNRKFLPAYQEKIKCMLALDKVNEALKISDSTLSLQGSAMNYYWQGVITERLNSYQKAEWAYGKSIKEDKKFIDSYIALANMQINLDKADEALAICNGALEIDPVSRAALLARSKVFMKRQEFQNAVNDISKIILQNPDDQELYLIRGTYYQMFKQHQNAINDFSKALVLNPVNAEALFQRARSNEEIHNFQAAVKDYEKLVAETDSNLFSKQAGERLYELNRESDAPVITLTDPSVAERSILEIPDNKTVLTVKGFITDKSNISHLAINHRDVKFEFQNNRTEFTANVPISDSLRILAEDVYQNRRQLILPIRRTETRPPRVSILVPYASSGEMFLDSSNNHLYLEGRITDENPIKSIVIDDVTASYKINEINPTFSATIEVNHKTIITVEARDIFGNTTVDTFRLKRVDTQTTNNAMGKTWAVFVENSDYQDFDTLKSSSEEVNLMKAALSGYQVHAVIHKKNMTGQQMEHFFSTELRDLVRGNHVTTLMIWYAGHGKCVHDTGFWIPVDASPADEMTYYSIQHLKAAFLGYAPTLNHTLVISDACETGSAFNRTMRTGLRERSCNDGQLTRMKSAQVLSSARYEFTADPSQFTRTFANILANNSNSCLPIDNIAIKVMNAIHSSNPGQKPKFGKISGLPDEDGTFFFMKKE